MSFIPSTLSFLALPTIAFEGEKTKCLWHVVTTWTNPEGASTIFQTVEHLFADEMFQYMRRLIDAARDHPETVVPILAEKCTDITAREPIIRGGAGNGN